MPSARARFARALPDPGAVEAVLFDWGGTLTPWHNADLADLWVDAARLLRPDDPGALSAALAEAEAALWERCVRTGRSARISEVTAAACRATGLDVDQAVHDDAILAHLEAITPLTVARPEADGVLRTLRSRGFRTGLISNTHWPADWHERFLRRDGLLELLDVRIYSSELDHIKPHPSVFRAALDRLGVRPEVSVFVGDRPIDDIAGANAAGLRTIWLPNGQLNELEVPPDATVHALAEVIDVIDRWQGQRGTPPTARASSR